MQDLEFSGRTMEKHKELVTVVHLQVKILTWKIRHVTHIVLHTTNAEEKVFNMKLKNQTNLSQVQFSDASEFLQKTFAPQDQILCLCVDTTSTDNQVVYHPKTINTQILSHPINTTVVPNGCVTSYLLSWKTIIYRCSKKKMHPGKYLDLNEKDGYYAKRSFIIYIG